MDTNIATLKITRDSNGALVQVNAYVPTIVYEKNGVFIVKTPSFKSLGYSEKSFEDAYKNHEDGLRLYFTVLEQRGTLTETLLSLGWNNTGSQVIGGGEFGSKLPLPSSLFQKKRLSLQIA
jgi:predicted RNase H-like HicB family nuclease